MPNLEATCTIAGTIIGRLKVGLYISRDHPRKICSHVARVGSTLASNARRRRIKYKAWGNAPGVVPTQSMRAAGAKTVQTERHELALMAEVQPVLCNSSRRRHLCERAYGIGYDNLDYGGNGGHTRDNAYGYCCACSATIVWWLCTWGAAPGFILYAPTARIAHTDGRIAHTG